VFYKKPPPPPPPPPPLLPNPPLNSPFGITGHPSLFSSPPSSPIPRCEERLRRPGLCPLLPLLLEPRQSKKIGMSSLNQHLLFSFPPLSSFPFLFFPLLNKANITLTGPLRWQNRFLFPPPHFHEVTHGWSSPPFSSPLPLTFPLPAGVPRPSSNYK